MKKPNKKILTLGILGTAILPMITSMSWKCGPWDWDRFGKTDKEYEDWKKKKEQEKNKNNPNNNITSNDPQKENPEIKENKSSNINEFKEIYNDKTLEDASIFEDKDKYYVNWPSFYSSITDPKKLFANDLNLRKPLNVWFKEGTKRYYDYVLQMVKHSSSIKSLLERFENKGNQFIDDKLREYQKIEMENGKAYELEKYAETKTHKRLGQKYLLASSYNLQEIAEAYKKFYLGKDNAILYNGNLPEEDKIVEEALTINKQYYGDNGYDNTTYSDMYKASKYFESLQERHFTLDRLYKSKNTNIKLQWRNKPNQITDNTLNEYFTYLKPFRRNKKFEEGCIGPKVGDDMDKQWEPTYYYHHSIFYTMFIPYLNSRIQGYQLDFLNEWVKFITYINYSFTSATETFTQMIRDMRFTERLEALQKATTNLLNPYNYWNHTDKNGKNWLFMDEELEDEMDSLKSSNQRQYYKLAMFINNNVLAPFWYLNKNLENQWTLQGLLNFDNKCKGIWETYYKPEFGEIKQIVGNTEEDKQRSAKIKIKNFIEKYLNCTNEFANLEYSFAAEILTADCEKRIDPDWVNKYEE